MIFCCRIKGASVQHVVLFMFLTGFVIFEASQVAPKDEEDVTINPDDYIDNVPFQLCGPSGGVEEGQYTELKLAWMDPPCEMTSQGYCRLFRNATYKTRLHFLPKVGAKEVRVKTTAVQATGWETSFWREYETCGWANITCPLEPGVMVYAHNEGKISNKVPPTRVVLRLRMLGIGDDDVKRVYSCRQIPVQFY